MESRGAEAVLKVMQKNAWKNHPKIDSDNLQLNEEFGGIEGLCTRLGVDQCRGVPSEGAELARRREKYGPNTIPTTEAKPFWRLLFDAARVNLRGECAAKWTPKYHYFAKDPTLIILILAGFISLALSFVEPGQGGGDAATAGGNWTMAGNGSSVEGGQGMDPAGALLLQDEWNATAHALPETIPS
jgi:magnesium-transporting ATPase (P-type)